MSRFRTKRIQRGVEYSLLIATHLFFLLAFRHFYTWWMAIGLGGATFFMNFRLTQLRERRRAAERRNRKRIIADTFESLLFLAFVILISTGGAFRSWLNVSDQEYLGYIAAILFGLFLAGFLGETYWQTRRLPELGTEEQEHYMANLHRSIIFPYIGRR
jgi:fatty acid desaturase